MRPKLSLRDIECLVIDSNLRANNTSSLYMLGLLIEWYDRSKDEYNGEWLDTFRPRVKQLLKSCGVNL
jgi:hypothetical protein